MHLMETQNFRTYCQMTFLSQLSKTARTPGSGWSARGSRWVSPCPVSPLFFPSMMAADTSCCQPTRSRLSGITLGLTPVNSQPNQESLSTLTRQAMGAVSHHLHATPNQTWVTTVIPQTGTFHLPHNTADVSFCPTFCLDLLKQCHKRLLKNHANSLGKQFCDTVVPPCPCLLGLMRDCHMLRRKNQLLEAVTVRMSCGSGRPLEIALIDRREGKESCGICLDWILYIMQLNFLSSTQ